MPGSRGCLVDNNKLFILEVHNGGSPQLQGFYDPTERDNAKPSDMPDVDWKKLKNKTLCVIHHWVDISVYNHVSKEKDPHTLWKDWENIYEMNNTQVKILLMSKLKNLKFKEG